MSASDFLYAVEDAPYIHVRKTESSWSVSGADRWQSAPYAGHPSGWHWRNGTLHIRSSRLGFAPLFHWHDGDAIAVSPSLPKLLDLGAPQDLDDGALAVFLRLGFYLGEQTPFRAIRQLSPATDLTWPDAVPSDAQPLRFPALTTLSYPEAVERYASLFRHAVLRLVPDTRDILLPLSGGADSRHILFELVRAGCCPATVTLHRAPPDEDNDLPVARMLSEQFDLDHVELPREPSLIAAETAKNPVTDFCADEHGWMLPLRRYGFHRDFVAFDGIAGDVLSAGLYLHGPLLEALQDGRVEDAADMLLGVETLWSNALEPAFYRRISRDAANDALCRELRRHLDAPNPVSSFLFWNRTRREMSLFGFKYLGDVRMPYLDDAVYDHLASLPPSFFVGGKFHIDTINHAFPEYAGIPYAGKSVSSRTGRWRFRMAALGALPYFWQTRSRWFRRGLAGKGFLDLKTKPADIWRIVYLLQLERTTRDRRA